MLVVTTAALASVLAGSAVAAWARPAVQPVAYPGIGRSLAGPGPAWLPGQGALVPESKGSAGLEGVFCTSAASCWAVGYFKRNGAWLNEALRWNGHRWTRVTAPNPGGTASGDTSQLFGVRCTAAVNCWAVGSYKRHGAALDEALHWNGKNWSRVTTPTPAGTLPDDFNELFDVACTSPDNCWADGEYGVISFDSEVTENQALHWNGKTWSLANIPDPGGFASNGVSALGSIRCTSPRNCWAVGSYGSIAPGGSLFNEVLHWNGHKWSLTAVPDPSENAIGDFNDLQGLACTSAANCWAAGSDGTSGSAAVTFNQALHWNGHKWSEVATPEPDGTGAGASNILVSVSCSSPGDCWTVGYLGTFLSAGPILNEALHWNGTAWSKVSTPDLGGSADGDTSFLYGVRCTSRTNCWAVGLAQPSGESVDSQLVHWNGVKWSAAVDL